MIWANMITTCKLYHGWNNKYVRFNNDCRKATTLPDGWKQEMNSSLIWWSDVLLLVYQPLKALDSTCHNPPSKRTLIQWWLWLLFKVLTCFLSKRPHNISMLRHSHTHTNGTAIGSNLVFSIFPRDTRTCYYNNQPSDQWMNHSTSWVTQPHKCYIKRSKVKAAFC